MTEIIRSLADLSGRYDAVFCDLWGCLHNGKTAFPAAVAALQGFRAAGGKVVLLTNAPRPKSSVIKQLDGLGVPRDAWDIVVTSGDAAQMGMLSGAVGRKVHHIGAPKDEVFFTDFADDLHAYRRDPAPDPPRAPERGRRHRLHRPCRRPDRNARRLPRHPASMARPWACPCFAPTPISSSTWATSGFTAPGRWRRPMRQMGGTALYFGKPHPPIYDLARRRLAELPAPGRPADPCIGDGIATDIQGGMAEGLDTLFITGGLAAEQFGADVANPDPGACWTPGWTARQLSPTYAMGRLR